MKSIHQDEVTPESSAVSGLLERRAQVEQWLARLEEADPDVPERVIARVREDYQTRLQEITGQLAAHRASIESEVQRLDEELATSVREHDEAVESLAEARLRQRIGELSESEWDTRRADLEEAVETAAGSRTKLEQEAGTMREILSQLQSSEEASPPPAGRIDVEPELLSADFTFQGEGPLLDAEGELVLPSLDDFRYEDSVEAIGAPGVEFLEELDRAISDSIASGAESGSGQATPPGSGGPNASQAEEGTSPQKGVKCTECGYTNDPSAWYCGVCGVDLA